MATISRRKFLTGGVLASFSLLLADAFWFEKYVVEWKTHHLIADNSKPLNIIQLSDLHLKGVKAIHHRIAEKINSIRPDLVVFSGDAVDANINLPKLDKFLALIDNSILKFAITGNWEYWGKVDIAKLKSIYKKHNTTLLINENKTVTIAHQKVLIVGVDDFIGGHADFGKAIQNIEIGHKTIVLSHCPAHFEKIIAEKGNFKIDLVLSGHTHGGQINIFGYVPFKPRGSGKYLKGWYDTDGMKMYVSKGIGTSILPIRFGARAEVALFVV